MHRFDPCQLNAAIAVITNQLYCSMSRQDFVNLGIILSMLSRSIIQMATIEELLNWEHRDLRAERLQREAKERKQKLQAKTPAGEEAVIEGELANEELLAEEELLIEEEILAAGGEL